MLEPLFRCNLACAGCGKIQYPPQLLKKSMPAEQALAAADECGAPMVSIAGGEPLMHPEIGEIARRARGAQEVRLPLHQRDPARRAARRGSLHPVGTTSASACTWTGSKEDHDEGGLPRRRLRAGRRRRPRRPRPRLSGVTTNTTLFDNANPLRVRDFFDEMTALGRRRHDCCRRGYSYSKAPGPGALPAARAGPTASSATSSRTASASGASNQSPLFLQYLMGKQDFECTPWGESPLQRLRLAASPAICSRRGTRPPSKTSWTTRAGTSTGGPAATPSAAIAWCHSGHEPTAVNAMFTPKGMKDAVAAMVTGKLVGAFDERREPGGMGPRDRARTHP